MQAIAIHLGSATSLALTTSTLGIKPQLLYVIKTYPMLYQVGHAFGRVEFKFHISIKNILLLNNKYSFINQIESPDYFFGGEAMNQYDSQRAMFWL